MITKVSARIALLLVLCLGLAACFGFTSDMTPVEGKPNTYTFHITGSVECGGGCSDKKAQTAITKFMTANNYKKFVILSRTHKEFPENTFTYIVQYGY